MVEEGEYTVRITLTTSMGFSPIERDKPLSKFDAIDNAFGTMPDGFWDQLEAEGWSIEATAERV